jgi:hypothetical protein
MKLLKERHLETVSDIQWESQAVLNTIKENGFHVLLKCEENDGIGVYIPKETIIKEMAAKIKLSQHLFFDPVQELPTNPHNAIFLGRSPPVFQRNVPPTSSRSKSVISKN